MNLTWEEPADWQILCPARLIIQIELKSDSISRIAGGVDCLGDEKREVAFWI